MKTIHEIMRIQLYAKMGIRDRSLFMEYTGSGKIDPGPRNFLSLFARAMKFI